MLQEVSLTPAFINVFINDVESFILSSRELLNIHGKTEVLIMQMRQVFYQIFLCHFRKSLIFFRITAQRISLEQNVIKVMIFRRCRQTQHLEILTPKKAHPFGKLRVWLENKFRNKIHFN